MHLKCYETLGDLHSHCFTRSPQLFFSSSFSAHLNVLSALLLISWNHLYLIHITTYEFPLFNILLSYSSNLSIFWIYKQLKLYGYITISIRQKRNSKLIPTFFSSFCVGMWCFHSAVPMHNFDCFVCMLTINISTVFLLFKLHPLSHSLFTIILLSTLKIKIFICCIQLSFSHIWTYSSPILLSSTFLSYS